MNGRFQSNKFTASYSSPQIMSDKGTHGGEAVAVKSHIASRNIPTDTMNLLESQFGAPRFAARIISFRQVDVLFIMVLRRLL